MKSQISIKSIFVDVVYILYILLFVYAAVSKLLDFENFQVQLGQSPLLSVFASWVSWLVPAAELIIALLLVIPKFRRAGLFAAFGLMTMFTAYIFIILHFSSFVPCSCGGILEKMNWNVHLIFNVIFVILAAAAIIINDGLEKSKTVIKKGISSTKLLSAGFVLSTVTIVLLFLLSEDIMHHENPFIRRYPQHPIALQQTIDLKFNSYYFAGYENHRIYLGNYTDPLHLISLDSSLKHRENIKITFGYKQRNFRMVQVKVKGAKFYLTDGTVPCIFTGSISDWKITKELKDIPYFSLAEPTDSTALIIRSSLGTKGIHVLGAYNDKSNPIVHYNKELLHKQLDGVFDTDGLLLSNKSGSKTVYIYYYRNEFTVIDTKANLLSRGHTIDTISHAQIKVAFLKERGERKMAAPPLMVNESAVICENLLFVQSKISGRYEPENLWKDAEIIDVYNLNNNSYLMSFALYKNEEKKLQYFYVTTTHLYALLGSKLTIYNLKHILKKEMKTVN